MENKNPTSNDKQKIDIQLDIEYFLFISIFKKTFVIDITDFIHKTIHLKEVIIKK